MYLIWSSTKFSVYLRRSLFHPKPLQIKAANRFDCDGHDHALYFIPIHHGRPVWIDAVPVPVMNGNQVRRETGKLIHRGGPVESSHHQPSCDHIFRAVRHPHPHPLRDSMENTRPAEAVVTKRFNSEQSTAPNFEWEYIAKYTLLIHSWLVCWLAKRRHHDTLLQRKEGGEGWSQTGSGKICIHKNATYNRMRERRWWREKRTEYYF